MRIIARFHKVDKGWRKKARGAAKKIYSREMFTDIEQALKKALATGAPDPLFRRSVILLTDGLVDVSKQPEKSEASRQRILEQVLPSISQAGAKTGRASVPLRSLCYTSVEPFLRWEESWKTFRKNSKS
ncbi:MAG: hypothetical protein ABFS45_20355 [Pseudomonadota bacterium]